MPGVGGGTANKLGGVRLANGGVRLTKRGVRILAPYLYTCAKNNILRSHMGIYILILLV